MHASIVIGMSPSSSTIEPASSTKPTFCDPHRSIHHPLCDPYRSAYYPFHDLASGRLTRTFSTRTSTRIPTFCSDSNTLILQTNLPQRQHSLILLTDLSPAVNGQLPLTNTHQVDDHLNRYPHLAQNPTEILTSAPKQKSTNGSANRKSLQNRRGGR